MTEINIKNAQRALIITTVITFFVAGFKVFMAYSNYKFVMSISNIAV